MNKTSINFPKNQDITKELWIEKRTKALEIIQNGYELYEDELSHIALDYLIQLLKLDGDNEYILNKDRKIFEVNNE